MKIAQVAPLHESVPPRRYGGTERVVHYLTEELVHMGHEVTLFASGDSHSSARLQSVLPEALRLGSEPRDPAAWHLLHLERAAAQAEDFDILHFHTDFLHFPHCRHALTRPHVTTLHGRLDLPHLGPVFQTFAEIPVVSISRSQRLPLAHACWTGTVYNGIPADAYRFRPEPGNYLAFLGRFSPEKGPESAIRIALQAGLPLRMAAKIDPVDRDYFEARIRPHLSHPLLEYVGEVNDAEKDEFLGNALALLFPIDWPEPFGLVMIEAMACGTPVVARPLGAVPEVVADGVSGWIVENETEAVRALGEVSRLDRAGCRAHFLESFSARRMAEGYLEVYRRQQEAASLLPPAEQAHRERVRRAKDRRLTRPVASVEPPRQLTAGEDSANAPDH